MASLASMVLASLVLGTVYNLTYEAAHGEKPFRPLLAAFVTRRSVWATTYSIDAVAGGAALLLNLWINSPGLIAVIVGGALLLPISVFVMIQEAASAYNPVSYAMIAASAAGGTLWFLNLMGG